MNDGGDSLFYLGAGPVAALALGLMLIPFREATTASNLAFAFLALTIVTGEAGGRWAATATALASALSLNFFLTRPYLTLVIHGRDDVIAFLGLLGCGLIAAALGSRRSERRTRQRQLEVLYQGLRRVETGGTTEHLLQELLDSACAAFPVAALAARDRAGRLLAGSGDRRRTAPEAAAGLETCESLEGARASGRLRASLPLPEQGFRLSLLVGRHQFGSLEAWGDGRPANREARQALLALTRIVAMVTAAARLPAATAPAPGAAPPSWIPLSGVGSRE